MLQLSGKPAGWPAIPVQPCADPCRFDKLNVPSRAFPRFRSSVAQWQSIRLLTGGLLVRVQPEEPSPSARGQLRRATVRCRAEAHARSRDRVSRPRAVIGNTQVRTRANKAVAGLPPDLPVNNLQGHPTAVSNFHSARL